METIKLKVLDKAGHTRMTCEAAEAVSLVYTSAYQPGGQIVARVSCQADLSDLTVSGLPGTKTYTSQAIVPIETWRARPGD